MSIFDCNISEIPAKKNKLMKAIPRIGFSDKRKELFCNKITNQEKVLVFQFCLVTGYKHASPQAKKVKIESDRVRIYYENGEIEKVGIESKDANFVYLKDGRKIRIEA